MFWNELVQPQQIFDVWNLGLEQQAERLKTIDAELDKMQRQSVARTQQALEESTRLVKESLVTAGDLAGEWRKWWWRAAEQTAHAAEPSE